MPWKMQKQTNQPHNPNSKTQQKPNQPTYQPTQNTKQAVVSVLQVNSAGTPLLAIQVFS